MHGILYLLRRGTHLANRNIYATHLGTDTLTNLGPSLWKFVIDKIKILQCYQSSNLGLKLEPLTTVYVGSAKLSLRILILLKFSKSLMESVRISFSVLKHWKSLFKCFSELFSMEVF